MVGVVFLSNAAISQAVEPIHWEGTVTAVNSNGNRENRSFTAVDANGQVKIFYISTLEYLKVTDRVSLSYLPGKTFPYVVTRIKFLPPTP